MATYELQFRALPRRTTENCVVGDDLVLLYQLKLNGTAVNLTGATLTLDGEGPGGVAMTSRTITPSDAAAGSFDAGLTAAETTALGVGTAHYQVECLFPAGNADLPGKTKTLLDVTVNLTRDRA